MIVLSTQYSEETYKNCNPEHYGTTQWLQHNPWGSIRSFPKALSKLLIWAGSALDPRGDAVATVVWWSLSQFAAQAAVARLIFNTNGYFYEHVFSLLRVIPGIKRMLSEAALRQWQMTREWINKPTPHSPEGWITEECSRVLPISPGPLSPNMTQGLLLDTHLLPTSYSSVSLQLFPKVHLEINYLYSNLFVRVRFKKNLT